MTKYKAGDKVTIVKYVNVYLDALYTHCYLNEAKDVSLNNCLGQIKITITGNDFTVEKVTE